MFEDMKRAVATTARMGLDGLYQKATNQWAAGYLTDAEVQEVYDQIEKRRRSIFPERRRRRRKPTTKLTLAHRRQLANSGPIPSHLAAHFTTCELAVLAIIAYSGGIFDRTIKELADRARVGHSTVQKALRLAERLGLITIEERRVTGQKNDPNIVRIVSPEWLAWIRRGGSKKLKTLDTQDISKKGLRVPNPCNSTAVEPYTPHANLRLAHVHMDRTLPRVFRKSPIWKRV